MAHLLVFRQRGFLRRWRWHRVSGNGRILDTFDSDYLTKWSAERSAPNHPSPTVAGVPSSRSLSRRS